MTDDTRQKDEYIGFEQGPIRPPSEAFSLLLRLTRNCPWNRCTFCGIYKNKRFSPRSVGSIIRDIDLVYTYILRLSDAVAPATFPRQEMIHSLYTGAGVKDRMAFNAAVNWYAAGMRTIFLQDANAMIMAPDNLIRVLSHLQECFPRTERITSYARSHTLVRINTQDLERMKQSGLNRIHAGMESGSDLVLRRIKKGTDKAGHIKAGIKVKRAGIELSEYVMPGLGGIDLSVEHALETASALNAIDPDYIRIRTLAVVPGAPLFDEQARGMFDKPGDLMMAKELRLLLESLDGIRSRVKSDHILNLFETIEGCMPHDRERMIGIIDRFFNFSQEEQMHYQIGRRMGFFRGPEDLDSSPHRDQVRQICTDFGVTPENVEHIISQLMKRFV